MSSFGAYIFEQIKLHPSFAPQDAIKLSYQATFGAEHLLLEAASVKAYLEKEYAETSPADLPLFEMICPDYGRVNLAAWKHQNLPVDWLFRIFFLTASVPSGNTADDLYQRFNEISDLALAGELPFTQEDWNDCLEIYQNAQPFGERPHPVHHSDTYRTAEQPAYRIVHDRYLQLIPILKAIAALPAATADQAAIIAIDGRAASGKSTLAEQLTAVLSAGLVHMDDFFLPPALRSQTRLAEAGGNVHYERFAEEVLPHLTSTDAFSYICFDCSRMAMGEPRYVTPSPYRIVEGSYSCHPSFGEYADLKILCDIDPETQMQRILDRNGPKLAEMFRTRWIPMEEKYFEACHIRDKADLVYNTQ